MSSIHTLYTGHLYIFKNIIVKKNKIFVHLYKYMKIIVYFMISMININIIYNKTTFMYELFYIIYIYIFVDNKRK